MADSSVPPQPGPSFLPPRKKLNPVLRVLVSLRLTIVLLGFSMALVFFGTLDQVHDGIWLTMERYFRSFFVLWTYPIQWPLGEYLYRFVGIPLPGGYLLGGLLFVNLLAAHIYRFKFSWKKFGIELIHAGILLLLVSEFFTAIKARESQMWIDEGSSSIYAEDYRNNEFVIISRDDDGFNTVHSFDTRNFKRGRIFDHPDLPFTAEPVDFFINAAIGLRETAPGAPQSLATRGLGPEMDLFIIPREPDYSERNFNTTSAHVRLIDRAGNNLGTWLVSNVFADNFEPQTFEVDGVTYEIALRFTRQYFPFALYLHEFRFDRYPGTDVAMNFSSDVTIIDPANIGERRTLIYMNNPLRYGGFTFYQSSFSPDETATRLQVMRNPGWLLPYIAVTMVGLGLTWQFSVHFSKFLRRRPA